MSTYRIKELQNFANKFYNRLYSSDEETSPFKTENKIDALNKLMRKSFSSMGDKDTDKIKSQTINYRKSLSDYNLVEKIPLKPIRTHKKIKLSNQNKINIYKTLVPWIPPNYVGNYFENFKRLPDHYEMNDWEKVNIIFNNF
jgi:hypothetical protein